MKHTLESRTQWRYVVVDGEPWDLGGEDMRPSIVYGTWFVDRELAEEKLIRLALSAIPSQPLYTDAWIERRWIYTDVFTTDAERAEQTPTTRA